jgi:integrase
VARTLEKLNDRQVRTAKPKGKTKRVLLSDGGNLYLQVSLGKDNNVRRSWLFRYQRTNERVRDMGIGSLNNVGLAEARDLALKYRKLVKEGKDPIRERDAEVARELAASAIVMTFDEAAKRYIDLHRASWKNPTHAAQWPATLKSYVSPIIGKMAVADIDTPHIHKVLDPIWHEKPETASRVRGRIEAILGWATVKGFRRDENGHDKPNPARWHGHLEEALPSPRKVKGIKHQPALAYVEMPQFMTELREREGVAALALEFLALTCVRSYDVRFAKRKDINRIERVWTIPAFSKTGTEHRVPLSNAALAAFEKANKMAAEIGEAVAATEYLFPNDLTGAALSENALLAVIERMGRKGTMTAHGLRASFRTWALERSRFPWELCEISLGHKVGTKVERAYARGDALKNASPSWKLGRTSAPSPTRPAARSCHCSERQNEQARRRARFPVSRPWHHIASATCLEAKAAGHGRAETHT